MSNDKRPTLYDSNMNFFRNLILQARLVWLLMRDPRVPLWLKALPVGSLAYLVMPFDIVTDVIPILGQLDDLAVIFIGLSTFVSLCPQNAVEEHMRALRGETDGWKVDSQRETKPADDDSNVIEGTYSEPPPDEPNP
ncbi:MAG: DUF1232 domain-containing protein [Chloroflexi bacterium]|nr:DUF1232 domain-containing protein [Chloroflexota bacterium]